MNLNEERFHQVRYFQDKYGFSTSWWYRRVIHSGQVVVKKLGRITVLGELSVAEFFANQPDFKQKAAANLEGAAR